MRTLKLEIPKDIECYTLVERVRGSFSGKLAEKIDFVPSGYELLGIHCEDSSLVVFYGHPDMVDMISEVYVRNGLRNKAREL